MATRFTDDFLEASTSIEVEILGNKTPTFSASSHQQIFKRTQITWAMYILLGLYSYLLNAFGPLMPFLKSELNLSATEVSLHFSIFAVGMILAGFIGPAVTNWLGRKLLGIVGSVGMAIASVPLILGQTAIFTIGSAFLMGFLGTFLLLTVTAILSDEHGERRVIAFTEANMSGSLFATVVPLVIGGASTIAIGGWRGAIAVGSLALLGLSWWFSKVNLHSPQSAVTSPAAKFATAANADTKIRLPFQYWLRWTTILLAVALEFSMVSWSSPFLETARGLSKSDAASAVSLFLIAMLFARFAGSRLLSIFNPVYLLALEMLLTLLGFGLFWLSNSVLLSLGGLVICGLGIANLYPLSLDLTLSAANNQINRASARASLANGFAIFTAPLVLGFLADHFALTVAYSVFILFWVAMLILLCVIYRQLLMSYIKTKVRQ